MIRGRKVALVQPHHETPDGAGGFHLEKLGNPIKVRVSDAPLAAAETAGLAPGVALTRRIKFYGRRWPGDLYSEITLDGELWEQVGPAIQHNRSSPNVAHWLVTIRRRGGLANG